MALTLRDVTVRYGRYAAVDDVCLSFEAGALIGLIGPNGAGKSSLLKAAAGVLPYHGETLWHDHSLTRLRPMQRARTIAYLPQGAAAEWPISAEDLVALGRLPHRSWRSKATADDHAMVRWALDQCDAAAFAMRPIAALSGGERARVLLARALAVGAPVLLVDEPVQSLDPYHQLGIMEALKTYVSRPAVVVAVLHDLGLAARFCDRVVLMHAGRVVGDGAPTEVLREQALSDFYGVRAFEAEFDGSQVIVPWSRVPG